MERHYCTVDEDGYCDECGNHSMLFWENLIRTEQARRQSRRRNK